MKLVRGNKRRQKLGSRMTELFVGSGPPRSLIFAPKYVLVLSFPEHPGGMTSDTEFSFAAELTVLFP